MSEGTAIAVENLSKAYRIWDTPASRLVSPFQDGLSKLFPTASIPARYLRDRAAGRYKDFHALQNVSLTVERGESVGIVGRNGSGKSTLLQIIAGTLRPSGGNIRVNGRVAALLELGSGFDPEFTGRENVYLNASVLGISRSRIDQRFEEITSFADIGDFINQPVKTYSSGMLMRLAFAVQTTVEPDILIVDEALAVGDAPFQAKCFKRMRELTEKGVSILLVSHDIGTVRALCKRALCLSSGKMYSHGTAKSVCDAYEILCLSEQGIIGGPIDQDTTSVLQTAVTFHQKHGPRDREFTKRANKQRAGNGLVRLIDCYMINQDGRTISLVEFNQKVRICWLVEATAKVEFPFSIGITVKSLKGVELLSATDKENEKLLKLDKGQMAMVAMPLSFPLRGDRYYFTTSLFRFPSNSKFKHGTINFSESELLDLVEYSCYFEVDWARRWPHYGPVQQDSSIEIKILDAAFQS